MLLKNKISLPIKKKSFKFSLSSFALLIAMGFLFFTISCKKNDSTANNSNLSSFVGTWDKNDSVRLSIGADGKFTAQRWVAGDTSYANNYAVEGTATVNGDQLSVTVSNSNLAHLWSSQKITSITATATLSSDQSSVNFTNVKVLPADLDVSAAVLARLSNTFVKNATPTIKYPVEALSFSGINTFQPTALPTLPTTWTYQSGVFTFDYTNFEYGAVTSDASTLGLAVSAAGQHVHLIVDGAPYIPLPMAGVDMTAMKVTYSLPLADGDHTVVAFPSRSYHESFKNPEAIVMAKITVASNSQNARAPFRAVATADSIYGSRPVRTYSLARKENEKILVDFMASDNVKGKLTGTASAYSVRATINQTPYLIREWKPVVFQGLNTKGDYRVTLDLYDHGNKKILKTVKQTFSIVD